MTDRDPARRPTHPGAILREMVLPATGMTIRDAARVMGVSRQNLHRILAEKGPITSEMALRIGKFAGNGPEFWLSMQQAVDLWDARQAIGAEIEAIPTAHAA